MITVAQIVNNVPIMHFLIPGAITSPIAFVTVVTLGLTAENALLAFPENISTLMDLPHASAVLRASSRTKREASTQVIVLNVQLANIQYVWDRRHV